MEFKSDATQETEKKIFLTKKSQKSVEKVDFFFGIFENWDRMLLSLINFDRITSAKNLKK